MSKKVVDGIEISDDIPVTEYDGKFSGSFELDVERAAHMAYDDTVYFVVTTRLDSYAFKPTKFGDLKRVNTFKVDSVRAVHAADLNRLHQPAYVETVVSESLFHEDPEPMDAGGDVEAVDDEEVFVPDSVQQPSAMELARSKAPSFADPGLSSGDGGRNYDGDPLLKSFLEG